MAMATLSPHPRTVRSGSLSGPGGGGAVPGHRHLRSQSYDGDDEETDLDMVRGASDDATAAAAAAALAGSGVVAQPTPLQPVSSALKTSPALVPALGDLLVVEHARAFSRPSSRLQHLNESSSSSSGSERASAHSSAASSCSASDDDDEEGAGNAGTKRTSDGGNPGVGVAARAAALLSSSERAGSAARLNPLFIGLGEPVPPGFVANAGLDFRGDDSSDSDGEDCTAAALNGGGDEELTTQAGSGSAGHTSRTLRGSSPTTGLGGLGMPRRMSNSMRSSSGSVSGGGGSLSLVGGTPGRHEPHSALTSWPGSSSKGATGTGSASPAQERARRALVHAATMPAPGNGMHLSSAFRSPSRGSTGGGSSGGGRSRAVSAHSPLHASVSAAANVAPAVALASAPPDPSASLEPQLFLFPSVQRVDVPRGQRLDPPAVLARARAAEGDAADDSATNGDAVLVLEWAETAPLSLADTAGSDGVSELRVGVLQLDEDEVAEVRNLRLRALSAGTPRSSAGSGRSAAGTPSARAADDLTSPDTGNSSRATHAPPLPQPFNRLSVHVSSSSPTPPAMLSSASTATPATGTAAALSTSRLAVGPSSRSRSASGSSTAEPSSSPPSVRPLHVWFSARSAAAQSSSSPGDLTAAARRVALSFLQQRARQSAAALAVARGADAEPATLEANAVAVSEAGEVDLTAYRLVVEREGQESSDFLDAFVARAREV